MVVAVGCGVGRGQARSSGSLAASNDSKYLYAADTDNGTLFVLDSSSLKQVAAVKVGDRPFRVSVGKDDLVYVANRGSRSVSVISHGDWAVVGEIPTGVDPVGMQVSNDGKTLYVVSATATDDTDYGILQAIDTATMTEKWNLPVGQEPRGLALVSDDRALVSMFKNGEIVQVDLKEVAVIDAETIGKGVYTDINQTALTETSSAYTVPTPRFHPRAMTDLAATPDGKRVFATAMLSREAQILTNPTPATPYYASQGPRLAGSVATPALFTFDTAGANVKPLVEDVSTTSGYYPGYGYPQGQEDVGHPQTSFAVTGVNFYNSGGPTAPGLQGPSVAVVDMTGQWLFMVNRESQNIAVISTERHTAKPAEQQQSNNPYDFYAQANELPSVHSTANIGKGADGIVILGDNLNAYVYNQFDHTVQRLTLSGQSISSESAVKVASDVLPESQVIGRKMFFDANDRGISGAAASVACSSCHLEGRDDGHVWKFPDGVRQTPTLAGRGMAETVPLHWSGEFANMGAFLEHTIISRMGGTGIQDRQTHLDAFVENMPAPENPFKKGELDESQSRGAAIFLSAQCGTCHSGKWLTNNQFADVGTLQMSGAGADNGLVTTRGLNVPSLRGLARSAPYLHSGKATTLKERIVTDRLNRSTQHGNVVGLTDGQVDDLVAYLKTL